MNERQTIYGTPPSKRVKDVGELVITLYREIKNIWRVGELTGFSGQSIHKFLKNIGEINTMNYFSETDRIFLVENYKKYRDAGNLIELAKIMNRTVPFLSRKAKIDGLTDRDSRVSMKHHAIKLSAARKEYYLKNEHPRGMLNKKQSDEFKDNMSVRVKKEWSDPDSKFNSVKFRELKSSNQQAIIMKRLEDNPESVYSRAKNGIVTIGDKSFFARSAWECNVASYLQFLKTRGEILDWEYEPTTFWFEKIKRGVRSYKPDFLITKMDGSQYYIEVKGWMDPKSITKLSRMRIYHPTIVIDVIDEKRYASIKRNSSLFEGWGQLDQGRIRDESKICIVGGCKNSIHKQDVCRKHYTKMSKVKR